MFDKMSFDDFGVAADDARDLSDVMSGRHVKRVVLTLLCAVIVALFIDLPLAFAEDINNGAKVFSANCASCHMAGQNLVNPQKTLKKSDLEKYEMASIEAIQTQVRNGKNAMPGFNGRLDEQQIADVAAYVLSQADKDWGS